MRWRENDVAALNGPLFNGSFTAADDLKLIVLNELCGLPAIRRRTADVANPSGKVQRRTGAAGSNTGSNGRAV